MPVPVPVENEDLPVIGEGDERLLWVSPEREGGVANKKFSAGTSPGASAA